MERPKNITEYERWLKQELGHRIDHRIKGRYESVALLVRSQFEQTEFWKCLRAELAECEAAYRLQMKGYQLLMNKPDELSLDIKGFASFFLKTARKNIFENRNWPSAPQGDWITPENWFSKINDIVRTTIVVKYLDGVETLANRLRQTCERTDLNPEVEWEASEEGYYAAHIYLEKEYNIPTLEFDSEKVSIKVEIQVTTQLQEAIRRLTHKYYEERRKKMKPLDTKWQWDYESDEFIPNYLGHILHYVEGMIMEVRKREV